MNCQNDILSSRGEKCGGFTYVCSSYTQQFSSCYTLPHPTHFFCSIKFLNFPPKRMKQNMGHTALMLSGGGAQAMYHLGTFKALIESGLYEHIHVVSGTSGGR